MCYGHWVQGRGFIIGDWLVLRYSIDSRKTLWCAMKTAKHFIIALCAAFSANPTAAEKACVTSKTGEVRIAERCKPPKERAILIQTIDAVIKASSSWRLIFSGQYACDIDLKGLTGYCYNPSTGPQMIGDVPLHTISTIFYPGTAGISMLTISDANMGVIDLWTTIDSTDMVMLGQVMGAGDVQNVVGVKIDQIK